MGKWKQLVDANWQIPYVGGWCEGYVEGAFGQATLPTPNNQTTSGVWGSATQAWNNQPIQHTDYPPANITVPVYFELGSTPYGHVAIRLDDLYVASSTQGGYHDRGYIHPNILDLISIYARYNGYCTYLGWGEYVGNVRVVEYVEDIPVIVPEPLPEPTEPVVEEPVIDTPKPVEPVVEPPVMPELPKPIKESKLSEIIKAIVDFIYNVIKTIFGKE